MLPPLDELQVDIIAGSCRLSRGRRCAAARRSSAAGPCGVIALPSLCDMAPADNAPLWSADDQYDRLEELAAGTGDDAKEIPLRRDVRSLGMLLGKVLVEQAGEHLLEVVEQLRRLLIQQREQLPASAVTAANPSTAIPSTLTPSKDELMAQARERIARLEVEDAYRVTKAFAIYFELTNLAETNHRKRRRRAAKFHSEQPVLAGSFRGTLLRMRAAGISAADALAALRKVRIVPVFTAHPTEVARRTVLLKRRRIAQYLEHLDRLPLTAADAAEYEALILAEITSLWQTDEVRMKKPGVIDEVRMGLDFYPMTLFETLPRLYAELAESFSEVYGRALNHDELPELLHFGSWIGGDRDGNPLIKPDCTADALALARNVILEHYSQEIQRLIDELSSSLRQTGASDGVAIRGSKRMKRRWARSHRAENGFRSRNSTGTFWISCGYACGLRARSRATPMRIRPRKSSSAISCCCARA